MNLLQPYQRLFHPDIYDQAIPTVKCGGNHTPEFAKAAATIEAHNACLDVSKALAATGMRVLTDAEFFSQVNPLNSGFKPRYEFFVGGRSERLSKRINSEGCEPTPK